MALLTRDGLVAAMAGGQFVPYYKAASRTTIAGVWFSMFDLIGIPAAGVLSGVNTASGVVPDATVAGFPLMSAFGGGTTGYVSNIDFGNTVAGRYGIFDCLWKAGAYSFGSVVSLATQPSYSSRVPGGTDFSNTSIWLECVTAFTGNQSIAITYTNQAGVTGRTTGTVATNIAPIVGRLFRMPLQAGDTGVQKIESVTASVATVGTFNVLVLRYIAMPRVRLINDGGVLGPDLTGLPTVFALSAIYVMFSADSTSTGTPEMQIQVING